MVFAFEDKARRQAASLAISGHDVAYPNFDGMTSWRLEAILFVANFKPTVREYLPVLWVVEVRQGDALGIVVEPPHPAERSVCSELLLDRLHGGTDQL